MSAEGGATTPEAEMNKGSLPYFFQVLNIPTTTRRPHTPRSCRSLASRPCQSWYIDDLHGIEYQAQAQIFFGGAGIRSCRTRGPPGHQGRVQHHQEDPGRES